MGVGRSWPANAAAAARMAGRQPTDRILLEHRDLSAIPEIRLHPPADRQGHCGPCRGPPRGGEGGMQLGPTLVGRDRDRAGRAAGVIRSSCGRPVTAGPAAGPGLR